MTHSENASPTSDAGECEIMTAVRRILAERLFFELDEVRPNSRLIADLHADSLDFVDLQFVIEERFEIRFGRGEFFDVTLDWVTKDGFLQPQAVERLTEMVPELPEMAQRGAVPVADFFDRLTVESLSRTIRRQKTGSA